MSILSEQVYARLEELSFQLSVLEKNLNNAPEGRLRVSMHGKRIQFYQVTVSGDNTGRYLQRSEKQLIQRLAQKDYDKRVLKLLKQEKKLLEKLDLYYKTSMKKISDQNNIVMPDFYSGPEELLLRKSIEARRKLVMPIADDTETFVQGWLSETYEKKGFRDTDTEYYTGSGIRVRSKTELIIAEMLEKKEIPFYYEKPLYLKGQGTIYPDFTVLNKKRRKTMYWEHLGMMDDESYRNHALERINYYIIAGIFPGQELILTHETATRPIRTGILESVIDQYLLR